MSCILLCCIQLVFFSQVILLSLITFCVAVLFFFRQVMHHLFHIVKLLVMEANCISHDYIFIALWKERSKDWGLVKFLLTRLSYKDFYLGLLIVS